MRSHDIAIWGIRTLKRRSKPYQLRWKVGAVPHSKTFLTRALADDFRADLLKAARRGELFDTTTGLPSSILEENGKHDYKSWYEFAREYVRIRWPSAAAKTRESIIDSLATATLALVTGQAAALDGWTIRTAMRWGLIPLRNDEVLPRHLTVVIKLVAAETLPVADLASPTVARSLWDAAGMKLDGTPAARDTAARRRRALSTALEYAVDLGELAENPLKGVKRKRTARDSAVDHRVVANPRQVEELLVALSYVGSWQRARGRRLVGFFATLYYAGARPAEAVGLRLPDCDLPDEGWGLLTLGETRPTSGKRYTDGGEVHDRRGLKQRDRDDIREVPIPPVLVEILQAHIDEFGTAPDGRLFANERGGVLGSSTYARAWNEARPFALTPRQVSSPLAGTAYDLRHAALSTWLNGGVDATDVAERAGNSVEVLLKRYAKCLDGHRARNNRLIERALERR